MHPSHAFGQQGVQHHAAVTIDAFNFPNIACGGKHKKLGSTQSKSEVYAIRKTKNLAAHDLYGLLYQTLSAPQSKVTEVTE
jgi:hypothetical protein